MKNTVEQAWVSQMAEELLCEIVEQMSGIVLEEVPEVPPHFRKRPLGVVCGETTGDFTLRMYLEAEKELFERLAANMIGEPAKDQEEVEEYATEMFNTVCGRFVSELYQLTGQSARFLPTTYQGTPAQAALSSGSKVNSVQFVSDSNEGAIFSWTLTSQNS